MRKLSNPIKFTVSKAMRFKCLQSSAPLWLLIPWQILKACPLGVRGISLYQRTVNISYSFVFLKRYAAQIELRSSPPKIGCLFDFRGKKDPLFPIFCQQHKNPQNIIPLFHTNSREILEFDNSEKLVKFMMELPKKRGGGVQDCMPVGSFGQG